MNNNKHSVFACSFVICYEIKAYISVAFKLNCHESTNKCPGLLAQSIEGDITVFVGYKFIYLI